MQVDHKHFKDEAQVLAEIETAGYFPVTINVKAETAESHWHDFDAMTYILEGELLVTETESGEVCVCGAGDRLVAKRGILHSEKTEGFKAIVGVSIDPSEITQPVNKPPPVLS